MASIRPPVAIIALAIGGANLWCFPGQTVDLTSSAASLRSPRGGQIGPGASTVASPWWAPNSFPNQRWLNLQRLQAKRAALALDSRRERKPRSTLGRRAIDRQPTIHSAEQLLSLAKEHDIFGPISADDVIACRRAKDARVRHQDDALDLWLNVMPARDIETRRAAQSVRTAKGQFDGRTGKRAKQDLRLAGQRRWRSQFSSIELRLPHGLKKIAIAVAGNRGLMPRYIGPEGDLGRRVWHCLADPHAIRKANQEPADFVDPQHKSRCRKALAHDWQGPQEAINRF